MEIIAATASRCVELPSYSADQVALTGSLKVALKWPVEFVMRMSEPHAPFGIMIT
jgi:hypothetical protein